MTAIKILCFIAATYCVVGLSGCVSSDNKLQRRTTTWEPTISLRDGEMGPVPFTSYTEPVSTRAMEFDKKIKTLDRGASRATVLKVAGRPVTRWALLPSSRTIFEIAPGVSVHGPDYYRGEQLEDGEKRQHEVWTYEVDEGEQSVSFEISSLSRMTHHEGTTNMMVVREYNLYFAEDSLEKVEVGLSAIQSPSKELQANPRN